MGAQNMCGEGDGGGIYSIVRKGHEENLEQVNGDYSYLAFQAPAFKQSNQSFGNEEPRAVQHLPRSNFDERSGAKFISRSNFDKRSEQVGAQVVSKADIQGRSIMQGGTKVVPRSDFEDSFIGNNCSLSDSDLTELSDDEDFGIFG